MAGIIEVFGCDSTPPHAYIPRFDPRELDAYGAGLDEAVTRGGTALPAPLGGPLRAGEEAAMLAGPGDGKGGELPGRRSPAFRPDRVTELEGTLGYYEVFTPAITPFKRVTSLDGIALDGNIPALGISNPARQPVPLASLDAGPPDRRERDRFWGSVVLDFGEGQVVPLPTVSPESRIFSLVSEPYIPLRIERDDADNFFVIASGTPPRQVRITYLIDAPRTYFGAALPSTPTDALARELFPMPDKVHADALRFARELGLTRGMPVDAALRTLVQHFRSFEESREPPRDTGNIFLDLARNRRGVCRHRAYAFVIVAQALGIPTRFVQNEAHAWVELKLPEVGWLRLDLGGAAEGLEAHATAGRPFHRPDTPDPWPRPLEYEESYSRAAELANRQGGAGGGLRGTLEQGDETRRAGDSRLKPTLAQGRGEMSEELVEADDREPLRLQIHRYVPEVMRGGVLEVEGSAQALAGGAVEGLRIEVSLAETQGDRAVLLGVSVSDTEGRFHGAFAVPPDLDPADYALVVVTPGDAKHASARAQ